MNEEVLIESENVSFGKIMYFFVKRLFDILVGFVGVIVLIPISIVVKLLYILSGDFNSIFLVQNRIGKNGKEFKLYKFRSMIMNADDELKRILKEDKKMAREYKINKKLKDDPRITKVGKILRRTSVDELPQLINVFLGNMTLIGNRPYLPREKDDMGVYFDDIVKTKPGITGLWQVSGKDSITFEKRLILEKKYSSECSVLMDIKIFFKTFKAIVGGHGAAF